MSLMLFTHYLLGYVGTAICSVGLVLALCSVYIFTRRQMRSAVSTYLAGLSISDSCLLFSGLIFAINASIRPEQQSESFYSSRLHKYLFPYNYACIIWFQFTSVWITVGFAVDRWFAIKWPMLHYTYSSKRAGYIVVAIYSLGLIYALPRFFEFYTELRTEKLTVMSVLENFTVDVPHLIVHNRFSNNTAYQYTVHLVLYSVFQSILPLLMLSYFNVELIRSVNESSNFLQHCTSAYGPAARAGGEGSTIRYRDSVITRSVICLIGLFILCQVPASILNYIHVFHANHPFLYISYDVSNFLILLNSAVNFFVFTCFNRKFRRQLARVCFYTRIRSNTILQTSSHQSLKRGSSNMRLPQQNQFDSVHPNYWEYPERTGNVHLSDRSINDVRKKSSESDYHLQSVYDHSRSLGNIHHVDHNQSEYSRHSLCEFNQQKKSSYVSNQDRKTTNLSYEQTMTMRSQSKDRYHRQNNDKQTAGNRKKSSTGSNTSTYSRAQQIHYVTCRREKTQQQSLSSTTTTTSNLSRSVLNTSSDSSVLIDKNKVIRKFVDQTNHGKHAYRK